MRILLTRAEEAASRTGTRLAEAGHEVIRAPLLAITPLDCSWPRGPFDVLLATSGNAFAGLREPGPFKALPLYTVGARTAEIARAAGFAQAETHGQNAEELAAYLIANVPVSARFLYLAGTDRRPQLEATLRKAGRHVTTLETYRAEPGPDLPSEALAALKDGRQLTILHFSPRSARLFLERMAALGLDPAQPAWQHVALSDAVAKALRDKGCTVDVARAPDEETLLALIADDDTEDIDADMGQEMGNNPIRPQTGPEGDPAAMSDDQIKPDRPAARPEPQRPEPPLIDAVAGKPPAPATGPVLTAALGGGLVGAALIGVGLWAVGPQNDQAERMAALENAIGSAATRRTVESLDKRVSAIEAKLPEIEAAAKRPLPAPQAAPVTQNAANDDGQLTRALQDMRNELATLAQRLSTLEKASAENAAKTLPPEKIDALNRDIAQLGSRLAATEKNVASNTPGAQDGGGLAVAVALKAKLQDGQPFAKEWAALQGLNADAAALAVLKPFAEKGLMSDAALAASFAGPARAIATAPQPRPAGDAAWTDKISSALGRLVRVTPVDPAKGEDPASLTVRIQTALGKGDSAEALVLWRKLPEPARRDTAVFGSTLEARVNAERAVTTIMSTMVDRLGASKP